MAVALSSWLLPTVVVATSQFPEVLIYDGRQVEMDSTPLDDYFHEQRPRPQVFQPISTACYRGYIGTWEIKEGKLFLLKIGGKGLSNEDLEDVLPSVFPEKKAPLLADWFTGVLRVATGKIVTGINFREIYEEETYLFLGKGVVIGKQVFKNDPKLWAGGNLPQRRELGNVERRDPAPPSDWIDAFDLPERFEDFSSSGKSFKTRGYFFPRRLWIPPTAKGMPIEFPLSTKGIKHLPAAGSPVEITATIPKDEGGFRLVVSKIFLLRAGEKVHRPPYE